MYDPKEDQIRRYDEDGELTAAGFMFWQTKPRHNASSGCLPIMIIVVLVFSGPFTFIMLAKGILSGFLICGAITAAGAGWLWILKNPNLDNMRVKRLVTFVADGRILVSNHDSGTANVGPLGPGIDEVHSVSFRQARTTDGENMLVWDLNTAFPALEILLQLLDGRKLQLAFPLIDPDYAQIVATQLNIALNMIREAEFSVGG